MITRTTDTQELLNHVHMTHDVIHTTLTDHSAARAQELRDQKFHGFLDSNEGCCYYL